MSNNALLAFVTGLGTGYIGSKDKEAKQAREDEDRAMRKDEHTARMDELKRIKSDRQALVDANAPIAMTQGAGGMVRPDTMDNRDVGLPENASLPNEGLQQGGYRVAGKSFADAGAAQAEVATQNAPEARAERTIQALQNSGNYQAAQSFQNSALDQKTKTLGLDAAQLDFADKKYNRELSARLDAGQNWSTTAAEILSNTNVGSLAGVTVTAVPSADGKKVNFIGAMPDGTTKQLQSFDNSPTGKAQFLQAALRAPPEVKINYMLEQAKAQQTQANTDRDFDLRQKTNENTEQYRNRTLGIQASQEKRAAETHAVVMQDAKIPAAVKMQATSLAKQMETVNKALSKAMAEDLFQPESANAQSLLAQQANLGNKYSKLLRPYAKEGDTNTDVLGLGGGGATKQVVAAPADATSATNGNLAQTTQLPTVPTPAASAATPSPVQAPVRSTDGGQTWFLDLPAVIRDPSVPYYRTIPNPKLALGKQSFKSRGEAEAAFLQSAQ